MQTLQLITPINKKVYAVNMRLCLEKYKLESEQLVWVKIFIETDN